MPSDLKKVLKLKILNFDEREIFSFSAKNCLSSKSDFNTFDIFWDATVTVVDRRLADSTLRD